MREKRLRIGIDLDDVVFSFTKALVQNFNERYNTDFKFEDVFTYSFSEVFNIEFFELRAFIENMITEEFNLNLKLCEFARESILDLSDNEIFFITARVQRGGTIESLQKYFSNFELIFSSNPWLDTFGESKSEICLKKNIDFMIEDDIKHSKNCADAGIKVFLLDKPWNQNFEHENVVRVKDWREIKNRIKGNN